MKDKIVKLKESIWEEIRGSLLSCSDIGEFDSDLLHNEDIPRRIYKGRAVIPDSIFNKISDNQIKDSELYATAIESLALAAALRLRINEEFSIIFSKCYSCIYFKRSDNISFQYEQIFFSTKFIEKFGIDFKWDPNNQELKEFVKLMFNLILAWSKDHEKYTLDLKTFKNRL